MKYITAFLILLTLIACSNKITQNINVNTASLDGVIVPENGSADTLSISIVASLTDNDSITYTTTADKQGYFIIKNMNPGDYNIAISTTSIEYPPLNLASSLFINKKTALGEIYLPKLEPNAFLNGFVRAEDTPVENTTIDIYYKTDLNNYMLAQTVSPDTTGFYEAENLFPKDVKIVFSLEGFDPVIKYASLYENSVTTLETVYFDHIDEIPENTILIDGVIDSDWEPFYLNEHTSNWSSSNDFSAFYIAYTPDTLYIAVTGGFDNSGNCVNIYIDKDYKNNTGINDFSQIAGSSIGDHLRKNVIVQDNFGADFAFSEWALSSDINLVSLKDPTNVDQNKINFNYSLNSSVIEIAIPITEIYENGEIPSAQQIAVVALIGGGGDEYFADDTIPQQQNASVFTTVLKMKFPE